MSKLEHKVIDLELKLEKAEEKINNFIILFEELSNTMASKINDYKDKLDSLQYVNDTLNFASIADLITFVNDLGQKVNLVESILDQNDIFIYSNIGIDLGVIKDQIISTSKIIDTRTLLLLNLREQPVDYDFELEQLKTDLKNYTNRGRFPGDYANIETCSLNESVLVNRIIK